MLLPCKLTTSGPDAGFLNTLSTKKPLEIMAEIEGEVDAVTINGDQAVIVVAGNDGQETYTAISRISG